MVALSKNYSTHLPMLIKAVQLSDGPVMEIGGGIYSTVMLHWLCAEKGRTLVTYEDNSDNFGFLYKFRSKTHRIRLINGLDQIDTKTHWSVILVGHYAWSVDRKQDVLRLADCADYIVIHDTAEIKYEELWSKFKYCHHWRFCHPYTTIVSNFKDLSNL